uniref:Uncharacterized protein n=1 Tax=Picea glauca TaxID=3330 RepID=A0A117NHU9_PICGL|nr:hypothetical protein ABT39_MTgene4287 [Picea glauca]QHR91866.1 hypothetical protein Q903MT_gene5902 [Picea sitchensis]
MTILRNMSLDHAVDYFSADAQQAGLDSVSLPYPSPQERILQHFRKWEPTSHSMKNYY